MLLRLLKFIDRRRNGVPGEHLVALGTGLSLLRVVRAAPSPLIKTVALVAGLAMIYRAASGRDGLASLRRRPNRRDARAPAMKQAQT
jgi:hypothetical protein